MSTKVKKSRNVKVYDTDGAAAQIWQHLVRDFRAIEGNNFCSLASASFASGIQCFREFDFPELGAVSIGRYKAYKQLSSLLKKYRFKQDLYTDDELVARTLEKFNGEQLFFAEKLPMSHVGHMVLRRARKIARSILGKYDAESTPVLAKFGKKSSIGCPLALAYIDHKLTDMRAFSSSSECAGWFFDNVIMKDLIIEELVRDMFPHWGASLGQTERCDFMKNLDTRSLNLALVPKTWKILRPITPLTLIMLFYSFGVGVQVENRLRDVGIDIGKQQARHRKWIQRYSVTLSHATADMSSASQSLTSDILNRVLPREWYKALKPTFVRQYDGQEDGVTSYVESILPMGNGSTFPVETLVFYVILKAIAELAGVDGRISVYGDDLIYPSRLHKYVAWVFPKLKFVLNLDKTFVKAHFRESCGSDFYHGVDVRPAMLPEGAHSFSRSKYLSWLYKAYNSLCRRWDTDVIRSTLYYILTEIAIVARTLHRVPPSFPDTAGIKVSSPALTPLDTPYLPWKPIRIFFANGSRWFSFSFLTEVADKRRVITALPYYWQSLAGQNDTPDEKNFWDWDTSVFAQAPRVSLTWESVELMKHVQIEGGKGRKIVIRRRQSASCAVKNFTRTQEVELPIQYGSKAGSGPISDWT